MPTMKPSKRSAGFVPLAKLEPEERLQNALRVVDVLTEYKPNEFPERPELLTYDDGQLVEAYKARDRGDKVAKNAKEQLRYFGAWRNAVWRVESQNAGSVLLLGAVVRVLEASEEPEHPEKAKGVRSFLRHYYRCSAPSPIPDDDRWLARWSVRFSQNRELLPIWLRRMTAPPPGKGTRASGDDEPTQGYMDFGPDENGDWAE